MHNSNCNDNDKKEWMRRRQIRLVQVRKQSDDIAKRLRQRVCVEQEQRRIEKEHELQRKLTLWKVKRLRDLEQLYRNAITEIGTGHQMAIEEQNNEVITLEKQKENNFKAKERGDLALEYELKLKKEAINKKLIPVQRKKITRQIEDLRSCLVRSILFKEKSNFQRDSYTEKQLQTKPAERNIETEEFTKKINQTLEHKTGRLIEICSKRTTDNCFQVEKPNSEKQKLKVQNKVNESKNSTESHLVKSSTTAHPKAEKLWIDLGKLETPSVEKLNEGEDRDNNSSCLRMTKEMGKIVRTRNEKEKKPRRHAPKYNEGKNVTTPRKQTAKVVQCYDYSLRHNCTPKEGIYSVCRIDDKLEQPNANELARLEEKELEQEKQDKESKIMLAEKRGNRAIEKERISRNYRQLLTKLEKLGAKERLIKSYCHIPPPDVFMSDERRSEKAVRKQRMMDSKFEQIYYDVMGVNADADLKSELYFGPYNRPVNPERELEGLVTKLDFSQLESNLKPNSPASSPHGSEKSEEEPSRPATEKLVINKTPSSFHFKRTKFRGCDERVLSEIDQILEKSRKLRRDSERNRKGHDSEYQSIVEDDRRNMETELDVKDGHSEDSLGSVSLSSELCGSVHFSPCGDGATNDLCGIKEPSNKPAKVILELGMGDLTREFPGVRNTAIVWPVQQTKGKNPNDSCGGWSSSTSYRSLPSEIHPNGVCSLLKLLAKLREDEGCRAVTDEFTVKLEALLNCLVKETEESCADTCKEESREFQFNSQLNYYITKLLDMSRERIANLNVSSESETSLQTKATNCCRNDRELNRSNQTGRNKTFNGTSDDSRCERIKRAKELEKMIKQLKNVLESYLGNCQEVDKDKETSDPEATERCDDCSSGTAACANESSCLSERVVNCSTSGAQKKYSRLHSKSPVSETREGRSPRGCEDSKFKEQRTCNVQNQPGSMEYCDDNNCPYKAGKTADLECQVNQTHDTSLESLPNVMEELLKKNILTSPFQWDSGIPLSDVSCLPEDIADRPDNNLEDYKKQCAQGLHPYKCVDSCKGVCAGLFACKCLESCKGVCAGPKINSNSGPQADQKLNERTVRKKYVFRNAKERDAVLGMYSPIDISPSQRRTSDIGPEEELEMERQKQMFAEAKARMAKRFCSSKPHPPIYEGYPEKRPVLNVHIDTPSFRKVKNCPVDECSTLEYDTGDCSAAGEFEGSRTKEAQIKDTGLPLKYFQPCSDNSEENDSQINASCMKNKRTSSPKNGCHPENQKNAEESTQRGSSECPAVDPYGSTYKKRIGSLCYDFREGDGDGMSSCRPEMNTRSFDNEPPICPSTAGQTAGEHFAKKKHVFRSAKERDAVLGMYSPIDIPPCQRRTSDIDSEEEMEMERHKQMFAEAKERMAKRFCSSKPHPPIYEGYPEKRPMLNVHIDTPSFRKKDRHSDGPNETTPERCECSTPNTQKGTHDGNCTFTVDKKTSADVSAANTTRTICKGRRSNAPDGCATRTIFNPQFVDQSGAGSRFEGCQDSSVPFILNFRTAKDRDAAFGIYSPIGGNPADRDTSHVTEDEAMVMKHLRQLSRERQQQFRRAQNNCPPKSYPPPYEGYPNKRPVLNVHIDTPSFMKKDCCPDSAEEEKCPKKPKFMPTTLASDQARTCLCTKMDRAYDRSTFVGDSCNSQQQDAPSAE